MEHQITKPEHYDLACGAKPLRRSVSSSAIF
jgi:hypothetical protein